MPSSSVQTKGIDATVDGLQQCIISTRKFYIITSARSVLFLLETFAILARTAQRQRRPMLGVHRELTVTSTTLYGKPIKNRPSCGLGVSARFEVPRF